jgi:LemA protein
MKKIIISVIALFSMNVLLSSCGYNRIQGFDEEVKASWSEIQNQYQRRYDLIPNLVSTVKGYAKHENSTLLAVTEARAKVGQMKVDESVLNHPEKFKQFQAAQGELSSALSRLMVVVEKYPDLKASDNFRDLQAQLEGTENRIAVARLRYIEAVKEYNKSVRYFPTNLTARFLLHMGTKPNFELEDKSVTKTPQVKFD